MLGASPLAAKPLAAGKALAVSGAGSAALTGQGVTTAAGTLGASVEKALSGQAVTLTTGALTPTISVALGGQAVTLAQGALTPVLTTALVGQSAAISQGSLAAQLVAAITGNSASYSAGTVTPSSDIAIALTGQGVSYSQGALAVDVTTGLVGGAVTLVQGAPTPEVTTPLVGQTLTTAQGTFSGLFDWTFTSSTPYQPESGGITKAQLSDGDNLTDFSFFGSVYGSDRHLTADFSVDTYVDTIYLLHAQLSASGGWGALYTNGRLLQYATDAAPTTWTTLATTAGHVDGVNTPVAYAANVTGRYFRLYSSSPVYLAAGDMNFSGGSSGVNVDKELTGQTATYSQGTVTPVAAGSIQLTGSELAYATGSVSPVVSTSLVGQGTTLSQGTLAANLVATLLGAGITYSQGTVTPSVSGSVQLTGQGVTYAQGSLSPNITAPLSGQSYGLSQGSLAANLVVAISGQGVTYGQGQLTPTTPVVNSGNNGLRRWLIQYYLEEEAAKAKAAPVTTKQGTPKAAPKKVAHRVEKELDFEPITSSIKELVRRSEQYALKLTGLEAATARSYALSKEALQLDVAVTSARENLRRYQEQTAQDEDDDLLLLATLL